MSFLLIKGSFHVRGSQPDGDSIKFKADSPRNWDKLSGPRVDIRSKGQVQLRLEAVDSLETHYEGFHQPMELAMRATERLLELLGIKNVVWDSSGRVKGADDGTRGYILARSADRYGRPVCFVFAGDPPESDGSEVYLDEERLKASANYEMAAEGLVYPTYYNGLFHDLRDVMTGAVARARDDNRGIWERDRTNAGFDLPGLGPLMADLVIMPKLFRRIVEFMADGGSIDGFEP